MLETRRSAASETHQSLAQQLSQQFAGSAKWRAAFRASPARACAGMCSSGGAAVSAVGGAAGAAAKQEQLLIAFSPFSYDARSDAGGPVLGPVRKQGTCGSCVAVTVAAAAEASVASATGRLEPLSAQDLFFCGAPGAPKRTCSTGWRLQAALEELRLRDLLLDACLP